MHYSTFIAVGLVSLGCTITAIPFNGKPEIAKRIYTTKGPCTAICQDAAMEQCLLQCSPTPTFTPVFPQSTSTSTIVTIYYGSVCTLSWDESTGCDDIGDWGVQCSPTQAATAMPIQTPLPTSPAVLRKRAKVTATFAGCTVVCSDTTSGTQLDDVQCDDSVQLPTATPAPEPVFKNPASTTFDPSEAFFVSDFFIISSIVVNRECYETCIENDEEDLICGIVREESTGPSKPTPTPTPTPILKHRAAISPGSLEAPLSSKLSVTSSIIVCPGCYEVCGLDEEDEITCDIVCEESTNYPAGAHMTTSPANLEARAEAQARRAHEARVAGKFGHVARDNTVTVTVTSVPTSCTVVPQELAIQGASVGISEASAAIALVATGPAVAPVLPAAASAALASASAFLSSLSASPLGPLPVFANATVIPGPSAPSVAPATASNPTVTTSPIQAVSPVSPPATSSVSKGAASEGKNVKGFFLMVLTVLLGNIALMV